MATTRDGWTDLVKSRALSATILVLLGGLILYQGWILRSEIRDLRAEMRGEIGGLRTEMRTEIGGLHGEFGGLRESVAGVEVAVARIDARRSIRLMLTLRFAVSGEGTDHGGPVSAAYLLLARALPEFDNATQSALDLEAQTKLAEELWEDRANILARASPSP